MASERDQGKYTVRKVAEAIANHETLDWDHLLDPSSNELSAADTQQLLAFRQIAEVAAERRDRLDRALDSVITPSLGPLDAPRARRPEPAPPSRHEPLFRWGRLEALEKVGQGSHAVVYRAHDPELDRDVALKISRVDPNESRQIQGWLVDEGRKLARVEHPNVVRVRGAAVHDGRAGLWTDIIFGQTLADRGAKDGPFSASEAAGIGIDLCSALAALHAQGLVHCDLKPANVIREVGGRVVLTDFGSAEYVRGHEAPLLRVISGTPLTMAPEILVDEREPTTASDIYSLGVLLYWLVSGRYPVEGESLDELRERHRRNERVPLRDLRPDVPNWFATVVERATARLPVDRFASVGHLQQALRGTTPPPIESGSVLHRLRALGKRAAAVGAAIAIVVAVSLGLWSWFTPPQVAATFYRNSAGVTQVLVDGAHISGGDELFLEIRASKPVHVWVLNQDSNGAAHVLYPFSSVEPRPLGTGVAHRLPENSNWVLSNDGASETLYVIASRRQVPELATFVAQMPRLMRGFETSTRSLPQLGSTSMLERLHTQIRDRPGVVTLRVRLTKDPVP